MNLGMTTLPVTIETALIRHIKTTKMTPDAGDGHPDVDGGGDVGDDGVHDNHHNGLSAHW